MGFDEWWKEIAGHISISDHEMVAKYAWQAAYMQASAEMRGYIIDDIDYAEQDAVLEVDGVNLYFQFEREATLKEAIKYFRKELDKGLKSND